MIRIGFSTTNRLLSRTIRWITRGKVSHVWTSFRDETLDKTLVMHATSIGFNVETWRRYLSSRRCTVGMYTCNIPLDDAIKKLADWLGADYNYSGAFGAVVQIIARWLGRKIHNPWNDPRKLYCSEAIVRLLQYGNVPGSHQLVPESTSPEMLLEFVINSPFFERVAQ